jgi:uncharacterized membrane protein YbhN (UPF0104 family)
MMKPFAEVRETVMPFTQAVDPSARHVVQYRKPIHGSTIWWLRFLGVVAFIVILLRLPGPKDVQLFRIDLRWLGFCMLLTIFQLLLEAFVWQWLLSSQRIKYPYPKTLVAYLASQYLGLVTPGHVGEFLAAGYISMDTGITFGYALSSVVMKKVLAWVTILGFGIWGLPLLADVTVLRGIQKMVWASVIVVVVLSIGIGLWVVSLRRLARKWQKLSPWQVDMTEFWAGVRHLAGPQLIVPLILSAAAFSVLFFQFDAVSRALGISLPFVLESKIVALSRIAARVVPFSVVGFGSKDAAMIIMLTDQGVDFSLAVTTTLLLLMCSYLVTLLLSGLCWWIKPLLIRRLASASEPLT